MSLLAFIAQIISAIVWPAVVVVLIFCFRPHFATLASRLQSVKVPGFAEAKFVRDELDKARADARSLSQRTGKARTLDAAPDLEKLQQDNDEFQALSKSFPGAAIMLAFHKIERILDEITHKLGLKLDKSQNAIEILRQQALIDEVLYDLYRRLLSIRNTAAGGAINLTAEDAIDYRSLVDAAASQLRRASERISPIDPAVSRRSI
ncbi:MAG: hypothetical protein WDN49_13230 [Acetobacteraceae bacterium]